MTDKEIVERAKEAEKRTGFGELVHSPISKGVNSAFGIGFIEGMVEYRNSMQKEHVNYDKLKTMLDDALAKETKESWNERLGKEPKAKFKKGDTIRYTDGDIRTVVEVREDCYKLDDFSILHFNAQDNWELEEEHKKCMYSKDNYTDEDRNVLCDGCQEECEYNKKEEPVTSVWHEPSEIPEEKKWILLAHKEGWYHVGRLYEGQRKNLVISDGVSTFELNMFNKWVYVDDILKF